MPSSAARTHEPFTISWRRRILWLIIACLVPTAAQAHVGDWLIPVYEIPSADLPTLEDGTLEDWEEIVPDASVLTTDTSIENGEFDNNDFVFRAFFAWHFKSQQLYFAFESVDDEATGIEPVELMVDGDHSGGTFAFAPDTAEPEAMRLTNLQSQWYSVGPDISVRSIRLTSSFRDKSWAGMEPWARAAGSTLSDLPAHRIIEAVITPWDELSPEGPEASRRSRLKPGAIIGLLLAVNDIDSSPHGEGWLEFSTYSLGDSRTGTTVSDGFVDAELIPCKVLDCSGAQTTAVQSTSWARIKASLSYR
ncbi:MAG: hypothetical protein GKR89_06225 [Candidatus Latescibacteria bacterium]|nr:hypothetical protein [Candidatus Latescibacterota bacterium]